ILADRTEHAERAGMDPEDYDEDGSAAFSILLKEAKIRLYELFPYLPDDEAVGNFVDRNVMAQKKAERPAITYTDPNFSAFVTEVVRPAQTQPVIMDLLGRARSASDSSIRAEILEQASTVILDQPGAVEAIRRIYRLPGNPGSKFVSTRLEKLLAEESESSSQ